MQFILRFPALQGLYRFSSLQLYSSYMMRIRTSAKLQAGNLINLRSNYCKQVIRLLAIFREGANTQLNSNTFCLNYLSRGSCMETYIERLFSFYVVVTFRSRTSLQERGKPLYANGCIHLNDGLLLRLRSTTPYACN